MALVNSQPSQPHAPSLSLHAAPPHLHDRAGGRYTSDFIWNVDWKKALEREESLQRKRDAYLKAQEEGTTLPTFTEASSTGVPPVTSSGQAGAVSFSRLAALDSMDVDLTEVLIRKKREKEAQEAAAAAARKSSGSGAPAARTVPLPRNDVKKLERSNRAAKQMVVTVTSQKPEDEAARVGAGSGACPGPQVGSVCACPCAGLCRAWQGSACCPKHKSDLVRGVRACDHATHACAGSRG